MNTHDQKLHLDIGRSTTIADIEYLLSKIQRSPHQSYRIRLATRTTKNLLTDIWLSIFVGTVCKRAKEQVEIVTWGLQSHDTSTYQSNFFNTLHGIIASQFATQIVTDSDFQKLDCNIVERIVSIKRKGILDSQSGTTRTLIEYDPQQPVALSLIDPTLAEQDDLSSTSAIADKALTKKRLFDQLLLEFRQALEVGTRKRRILSANVGSIGDLFNFISELHDNAYEHGRAFTSSKDHIPRNIRFIRLKKHISKSRCELLSRTQSFPKLSNYIRDISHGSGEQVFIEASVSDFGPGIVDHFLQSSAGPYYTSYTRREMIYSLLNENLSAKHGDPAAGYGIQNALISAKKMSSFISLRTGEFWLAQSYADPRTPPTLTVSANKNYPLVTGTHWQIIWPNPL